MASATNSPDYAKLARLTGLPDLTAIVNPDRLERLVAAANNMLAHVTPQCPLRVKVALTQYAGLAAARLADPEALLDN